VEGWGGAPKEATEKIEALASQHNEGARKPTQKGFNGAVLDIKTPHRKR
jgi:hypothetical protein